MTTTTIKAGYKQTEIGVIPEDWEVKSLGEITASVASGTSVTKNEKGGIYPLYGSTGIIGYRKKNDYSGYKILVARVGANAGTVNKVQGHYSVSDNTLIIGYQSNINIDFQYYQLIAYNLNKLVFGSGQPLITGGQLKDLSFPLPSSKPEQKLIATTLSDTDELISSLSALITKKRQIKEGAMQELLTGKKRLAGFSGEWEVKKLGEIAEIATGNTPPTNNAENYGNEFLFVSPFDLGKSKFIQKTEKKLSSRGFNISRKFPSNSILYTCIGSTIGKMGIALIELTSNQQINAIFPNKSYSTSFLYYALFLITPEIRSQAGEQAVPLVNKTQFEEFQISIPEIEEQQAIAQILSDMDTDITTLKQKREKYKLIKQGMMQQLLTGKIRLI